MFIHSIRRGAVALAAILAATSVHAQSTLAVPDTLSVAPPAQARPEGAMDCAIRPSRVVEISSVIDGVLAEVFVRPGQQVAAGDPIARIDTDIAEAELAQASARAAAVGVLKTAEARASAAGAQYNVQRRGWERKVVSRADYERARGDLNVARQEIAAAREAMGIAEAERQRTEVILSKGMIRAPFAGIIGEDLLDPSEDTEGRPVAQLIVTDPMRVEVFARIEAAEAIRAGADHVVVARASDPVIVEPVLDYISPVAEASSQTIRVYYTLESDIIQPGLRCLLAPRAAAEAFVARTGRGTN